MNAARHETPEGFVLVEMDVDLWGCVARYQIEGTPFCLTRTPVGWRAQLAPHGKARRRMQGPPWETPRQALRYLAKYGHIRPS